MEDVIRDRIAAAVNMLRPDWPTASLRTMLGRPELANRPARDVAVAMAYVACDPRSETPARVLNAGPWWSAAQAGRGERTPAYLTMAEGCHCGRRLHEPDTDCPDPGRYRRPADPSAVAQAKAVVRHALVQAQAADEKTRDETP